MGLDPSLIDFSWPSDIKLIGVELFITLFAFIVLLLGFWTPPDKRKWIGYFSLAVVAIALFSVCLNTYYQTSGLAPAAFDSENFEGNSRVIAGPSSTSIGYAGHFLKDRFALFFKGVFLLCALLTILISFRYMNIEGEDKSEYYSLILFSTLGMMLMASSRHLVTIYVGFELMSLSTYLLAGFLRKSVRSNEAAIKYFLLGAFSSGILLYGLSLVYGITGHLYLSHIQRWINANNGADNGVLLLGMVMIAVGVAFKLAIVPFHGWCPDAYEGAPTSITAFMSVGPKAAAFAVFLRIFMEGFFGLRGSWIGILSLLAALTMVFGNVAAILQTNVKRLLAYSSIAHAGYALLGLIAAGKFDENVEAARFGLAGTALYMLIYAFMNIGAFAVVITLRRKGIAGEEIEDFNGLARRNPLASAVMLIFLLSLTGIPPMAGFVGKYMVFAAAIKAGFARLAVIAVVTSAVSLFYYMKILLAMYMKDPADEEAVPINVEMKVALAVTVLFTFLITIFAHPFVSAAAHTVFNIR